MSGSRPGRLTSIPGAVIQLRLDLLATVLADMTGQMLRQLSAGPQAA